MERHVVRVWRVRERRSGARGSIRRSRVVIVYRVRGAVRASRWRGSMRVHGRCGTRQVVLVPCGVCDCHAERVDESSDASLVWCGWICDERSTRRPRRDVTGAREGRRVRSEVRLSGSVDCARVECVACPRTEPAAPCGAPGPSIVEIMVEIPYVCRHALPCERGVADCVRPRGRCARRERMCTVNQ